MGDIELPPLCSSSDVANILGIERTSVPGMVGRNKSFPKPAQIIGSGPVWLEQDILDYKEKRDLKLNKIKKEAVVE